MPRTCPIDAELLAAVRHEVERLASVDLFKLHHLPLAEFVAVRVPVENARQGVVLADFAALLRRELPPAAMKAAQRSAHRLARQGKLELLRRGDYGERLTHLRLVGYEPTIRTRKPTKARSAGRASVPEGPD
jgi:hypothetical protein